MNHFTERYSRQIILKEFGVEAQEKLQNSSVLIIGLGGLGCPIVEYLAAMGIGRIGIADNDLISLSNLNRQIIFGENHVGKKKAVVVQEMISQKHPSLRIECYIQRWQQDHCIQFFPKYDLIVDATDNFATRYMINDACVLLQKPLVYGAVSDFEGQVAVFNVTNQDKRTCNYRDLFPIPPQNDEIQNCSERGVIGVLPGIIGCFQALEVVKLITGLGEPLVNKLLTYNGLTQNSIILDYDYHPESDTILPKDLNTFLAMDYALHCGIDLGNEITWEDAKNLIDHQQAILVDVRNHEELPRLENIDHIIIPLSDLGKAEILPRGDHIIFICQSGKRSLNAIKILRDKGYNKKIHSIKGGVQSIQTLW